MRTAAHNQLVKHEIKPSLQRLAVMEYLLVHHTHPTAETIFAALYPQMPTLSKTTVYNTLKLLSERGAILALDLDPQQTHFDGDTSAHAHFLCRACGAIHDLPLPSILPVGASTFSIDEVQLYYKGTCNKCKPAN